MASSDLPTRRLAARGAAPRRKPTRISRSQGSPGGAIRTLQRFWPLIRKQWGPLTVAILAMLAEIGLRNGTMLSENAAALVGAGVLSVIVYPAVAVAIGSRRTAGQQAAPTSAEPRNEPTAPGPTGEPASPSAPREPVAPADEV